MRALLAGAALAALAFAVPARAAPPLAAFTVLGPAGAVARAVTKENSCPAASVNGKPAAMRVRAPADARFPLTCELALPADAAAVAIGGIAVPVPRAPRRLALFGDSGCRVDNRSGEYQACNRPADWPFAATSAEAAKAAPDLVIHVGDYLYRESPCPKGEPGCAGSPAGDDWPGWQADFFTPAAPLLAAAPWIVVRGNHENCDRAPRGFFRLLDPRPLPQRCPAVSEPYRVADGALTIFIVDSGAAQDIAAPANLVALYRRQLAGLDAPPGAWLATHRPFWGVVRVGTALGLSLVVNDNATLQAASNKLPANIALILSGHIHLFEALDFTDHRAPQLIFGTAGSSLAPAIAASLEGHAIAGTTIAHERTVHEFGFTTMERDGAGWRATFHGVDGKPRFACRIAGPTVICAP